MDPILTGSNIFRSTTTITASQIRALNTTPILVAKPMPGKSLMLAGVIVKYFFGTQPFNLAGNSRLYYGPATTTAATDSDALGNITGSVDTILNAYNSLVGAFGSPFALTAVEGLGIWLVGSGGFDTGAVSAAVVTPGNAGSSYAIGDTGQIFGGDSGAVYEVTAVDGGGGVISVSIPFGGTGYSVGTGNSTEPITGGGDGTLELDITAISLSGDGTFEFDVLFQAV